MPSSVKLSIMTLKNRKQKSESIGSLNIFSENFYAFKLTAYEIDKKVDHDALPREGVSTTSCKKSSMVSLHVGISDSIMYLENVIS
jgi:hypothetical protein